MAAARTTETEAAPLRARVGPTVAVPRAGLSTYALVGVVVAVGLVLFLFLDARRRSASAPATTASVSRYDRGVAAPPPLYVPPAVPTPVILPYPLPTASATPPAPPPEPRTVYVPQPVAPIIPTLPAIEPMRPAATGPALVVDNSAAAGPSATNDSNAAAEPAAAATPGVAGARARAGMFANRATTVAQGTVIQAVLETALDSTRPGLARAIVSRDVRGFDGTQVLIPRGSRLIGEYRSEVAPGQRRAMVNWVRLIRPDGVTIAIGSPAADPLGRGGIRAKVDTHFLERFAGAILQSTLDIGVALAARSGSGGTYVVLPGTLQAGTQTIQPAQITNTLTVKHGTSISIFAARDLDFTGTGPNR